MHKERRIRAYVNLPTRMGTTTTHVLTIRDISLSGCLLVTNTQIETGAPISLKVGLPEGRELRLQGVIVRQHEAPLGYGINFDELTEEERRELALLIAESSEVGPSERES